MRTWRVLLAGCGTVGAGAIERLQSASADLAGHGCDVSIVGVLDPARGSVVRGDGLEPGRLLQMLGSGTSLAGYPGVYTQIDAANGFLDPFLHGGLRDVRRRDRAHGAGKPHDLLVPALPAGLRLAPRLCAEIFNAPPSPATVAG